MVRITTDGVIYRNGHFIRAEVGAAAARRKTIAYGIFQAHNVSEDETRLRLRFDALASHDITYVGIIQTARASGMTEFPVPYVLTNCHNSLCAVGGTINEDDHRFGLSAAKKYGGEFVPAHQAVIHQYMRERYAACGRMILASDSHTRYGAFGTLAVGEGGGELARQLLRQTYDIAYPRVVAVSLTGAPRPGVGPQDVALAVIAAVFQKGTVKNAVMEFVGSGIRNLAMDYRSGIDVMTTETACLSSVWQTDETVREALAAFGRPEDYRPLAAQDGAYYDALVEVDLSAVEPMIALPFHPSNAYPISYFKAHAAELLQSVEDEARRQFGDGIPSLLDKLTPEGFRADQGVIAGCSGGTYQNLLRAAEILDGGTTGTGAFALSAYPASMPVLLELERTGQMRKFHAAGTSMRSCFCGPCFGAGDVPSNGGFSIRHSTRNFPNREGSRPGDGQVAYVALMDARSIAATARNGGILTAATELPGCPADTPTLDYRYDDAPYRARVYRGFEMAEKDAPLSFGPNIADWPAQPPLPEHLLLTVAAAIYDAVTTTDELIPSGETSSYRSNPLKLAEFTLSRKAPDYVARAKEIFRLEELRRTDPDHAMVRGALGRYDPHTTGLGSLVVARKPGDGSAREQAASCQRVLGGCANLAADYATRRYRANLVNWGLLPFVLPDLADYAIQPGDRLYLPSVRKLLEGDGDTAGALLIQDGKKTPLFLRLPNLTREERDILLAGCLINYYRQ